MLEKSTMEILPFDTKRKQKHETETRCGVCNFCGDAFVVVDCFALSGKDREEVVYQGMNRVQSRDVWEEFFDGRWTRDRSRDGEILIAGEPRE